MKENNHRCVILVAASKETPQYSLRGETLRGETDERALPSI